MLKLFYFFRGYLWIRVSGASAERFINLCGIRHMMLWDIKKDEEAYVMCISLKSFFEMKDIVRKTSTRVAVLKRIGLPFLMSGVKKRWFFPVFLRFWTPQKIFFCLSVRCFCCLSYCSGTFTFWAIRVFPRTAFCSFWKNMR